MAFLLASLTAILLYISMSYSFKGAKSTLQLHIIYTKTPSNIPKPKKAPSVKRPQIILAVFYFLNLWLNFRASSNTFLWLYCKRYCLFIWLHILFINNFPPFNAFYRFKPYTSSFIINEYLYAPNVNPPNPTKPNTCFISNLNILKLN